MSKLAVCLEKDWERVLVDVGSRADGYRCGLGYVEPNRACGNSFPGEPMAAEKKAKKPSIKKVVAEVWLEPDCVF
jgi:hypothetical protein